LEHGVRTPERLAERGEQIEHDADPGEMLPGETAARHARIHDRVRPGQDGRRQVMVGDQYVDAPGPGRLDAGVARDAVVDGHNEPGPEPLDAIDDLGRQPVAELETIRNEIVDLR